MKKRGQVTIFIIVGILLVASTSLFFLSRAGFIPQLLGGGDSSSVNAVMSTCLEEDIEDMISLILANGGYIESSFYTTYTFTGENPAKISYLCYANGDFSRCVNQNSGLSTNIESEIKTFLQENDYVKNCFEDTLSSFRKQGYEIESERLTDFDIELLTKKVVIKTDSEVILTKSGETAKYENFKVGVSTRLYELIRVVNEIVNKEAENCDFSYVGYMHFYPQFKIEKFEGSDNSEIYTVKHLDTNEKFRFAVRGCVIPPF